MDSKRGEADSGPHSIWNPHFRVVTEMAVRFARVLNLPSRRSIVACHVGRGEVDSLHRSRLLHPALLQNLQLRRPLTIQSDRKGPCAGVGKVLVLAEFDTYSVLWGMCAVRRTGRDAKLSELRHSIFRSQCCNNYGEDGRMFSNHTVKGHANFYWVFFSISDRFWHESSSTSPLKSVKKQKQGCVVRGTTLSLEDTYVTALQVPW